jgi:hypothetical protein
MGTNPPATETIVAELLTTADVAKLLSCGERTVWRWSRSGAMGTEMGIPSDGIPKLLLSAVEAAKVLSISARTLWSLTSPRGPIKVVRLSGRVLYSISALKEFIAEAEQANGGPGDD